MTDNEKKYVTVSGRVVVSWTVELPVKSCRDSMVTEDPAVEAALEAIPQDLEIHLWGVDCEPAIVHTEVSEDDVEIEEDERLKNEEPEDEGVVQDETWWESRKILEESENE